MTKFEQGRGSDPSSGWLSPPDFTMLAGSEERGYTHRQKRKEVSAMGFALNAAEDLEDLIYECKEVSASER